MNLPIYLDVLNVRRVVVHLVSFAGEKVLRQNVQNVRTEHAIISDLAIFRVGEPNQANAFIARKFDIFAMFTHFTIGISSWMILNLFGAGI